MANKFYSWGANDFSIENATEFIDLVHKWGFRGRSLDKRQAVLYEPEYLINFIEMLRIWNISKNPVLMRESLSKCLKTPNVKIARFSKWICFIDQSRYAIYDSRVSLALRRIKLGEKRFFPTLGSRPKGRPLNDYIASDTSRAAYIMAGKYMVYLDFLHSILSATAFSRVAELEMALFMLGAEDKYW